jgi:acyl carrier protein
VPETARGRFMSSFDAIRQEIADYLATNHGIALDSIAPEATFEGVGVDSLGMLGIATLLENKYGITFEMSEMMQLHDFSELMALVREKSAKIA